MRVTVGFATARLDVVTALEVGDGAGVLLAGVALELGVSVLAGWLA